VHAKRLPLHIDSMRVHNDMHWFYFSAKITGSYHTFSVENSLLCNEFSDQKNLVIVTSNNKEKGYTLNASNRNIQLQTALPKKLN
jgi:hypothetical protein